eukprot:TRINITY_DN5185_c0_g1_i3.p2 TRINITY_DN5185_c0_g1~~TRINITY_DN5185_c0_g1_i3.p2  ORF type:complete len:134 (+),score=2.08 TRINITY_DN5185_c0_g1_i3:403-804(+)
MDIISNQVLRHILHTPGDHSKRHSSALRKAVHGPRLAHVDGASMVHNAWLDATHGQLIVKHWTLRRHYEVCGTRLIKQDAGLEGGSVQHTGNNYHDKHDGVAGKKTDLDAHVHTREELQAHEVHKERLVQRRA